MSAGRGTPTTRDPIERAPTLLSAPLELAGDWGKMLPRAAELGIERMRHACLEGVRLISDRQPTRIRIDRRSSGFPAIWQVASLAILREYDRSPVSIEVLGALNRWPDQTGIPIDQYLRQWEASCAELHANSTLPVRVRQVLGIT